MEPLLTGNSTERPSDDLTAANISAARVSPNQPAWLCWDQACTGVDDFRAVERSAAARVVAACGPRSKRSRRAYRRCKYDAGDARAARPMATMECDAECERAYIATLRDAGRFGAGGRRQSVAWRVAKGPC